MMLALVALLGICAPLQASTGKETKEEPTKLSLQERDSIREKNFSTFLKDTVELRRELAEKQNQSRELLLAEKPDRAKIAMVSEQIYQIIDVIQEKARVAGIEQGLGNGTAGCACRQQRPVKTL